MNTKLLVVLSFICGLLATSTALSYEVKKYQLEPRKFTTVYNWSSLPITIYNPTNNTLLAEVTIDGVTVGVFHPKAQSKATYNFVVHTPYVDNRDS